MREAVRYDGSLFALLQRVIADRRGRLQPLFQVARLENLSRLIGLRGPNSGEAVGLKFNQHRYLVGPYPTRVLFCLGGLIRDAQLILHMMPDLVGDDVGASKIARRTELRGELLKERQIDIDPLVAGTVEGS